ncbi:MAG: cytochrome c [Gemmatimonadetes bacterium]|nr:cytochrome c [Gemmatimonadota bacterium]
MVRLRRTFSKYALLAAAVVMLGCASGQGESPRHDAPDSFGFGQLATDDDIRALDIDIMPDGTGLPPGSGSVEHGQRIYAAKCASCHGPRGRGDGPIAVAGLLKDAWGRPIKAHDFTWGLYKSGRHDLDLYRTVTTGLNGTPMAAYDRLLTNEERWDLVDYIKSLSPQRGAIGRLLKEKLE